MRPITFSIPLLATALAIPSLTFAQVQDASASTVQIYGQLTAGLTQRNHLTGDSKKTSIDNSVLAASLIGLRGSEDLGGGRRALFRLESGLAVDTGVAGATVNGTNKFWNRHSFVGLSLSPGVTVTLGRQYHAHADRMIQSLDVYNLAGTSIANTPLGLFGVNRFGGNDSRVDDSIKLRVQGPMGFTGGLSTGLNEGAGKSYGFDAAQITKSYTIAAFGAEFQAPNVIASTGQRPKHRVIGLGGQAPIGSQARVYVLGMNTELDATTAGLKMQKNQIVSIGASWDAAAQTVVKFAYVHDRGTDLNGTNNRNGVKTTWVASAEYALSKRTSLYGAYFTNRFADGYKLETVNIAALGRNAASAESSGISFGVRHNF